MMAKPSFVRLGMLCLYWPFRCRYEAQGRHQTDQLLQSWLEESLVAFACQPLLALWAQFSTEPLPQFHTLRMDDGIVPRGCGGATDASPDLPPLMTSKWSHHVRKLIGAIDQ